ncbi:YdcF family protein [Neorhodopirellula pilleata]|uniref:DUF218 domain-containing protein n=1 Tax=Neorhodopirellula pilleata TaxID=2714738 RepID=A0A5C6A2Q6_9BACT|nr:YdcF family protein [Neorhodopirellula pilleata]TWT94182.1 hypothetical protein Pla100_37920 [Neorhodopirellula pilleata]
MFSIPRETGAKSTSSDSPQKIENSDSQLARRDPPTRPDAPVRRGRLRRWRLIGWLALTALLPVSIFLVTYWQQGFVAAGRAGTTMVMPVGWVWLFLWAGTTYFGLLGQRRQSIGWVFLFLIWTAVGNGQVAGTVLGWVESPLPTASDPAFEKRGLDARLDGLVTLGGSANWVVEDFPEVNGDGERILSAAQIYHAGMTRTIITTGSSTDGIAHPCEIAKDLLISLGIPDERIFLIPGVNTQAEMESLAAFLEAPPTAWRDLVESPTDPKMGLVTSAFHMPRALRLAQDHGLDLVAIPCAFRVEYTERPWKAADWIPTSENQSKLGLAFKEAIAWTLGR